MALQHEWVSPVAEPETYPGVLRGYRHFKNADILSATYSKFDYPQVAEGEWWVAQCGTDVNPRNEHTAPEKSCRCGFYVNYYSTNSFYDSSRELPRGVVEASGRMVLGEKGFRAQKLRLVALTPVNYALGVYMAELFPWVKLYTSASNMYEDYPQEDLSSLLGVEVVEKNLKPAVISNTASVMSYIQSGGYSHPLVPLPVGQNSAVMPMRHLAALSMGQGLIYQGSLYDGTRLTLHPAHDHIRIERYQTQHMFDYSQLDKLSYVGPASYSPNFVHDLRLSDLNDCMIEVSTDLKIMYQLVFNYQGNQHHWNFVDGTCKWRKLY